MRGKWRGVEWAPVVGGKCTKHRCDVTPFLKMCVECHREQMRAAGHTYEEKDETDAA